MLPEYTRRVDECQSDERDHATAPVFSAGLLRRLGGCASGGPALHHRPEHTDRLSDVLDRLWAEILVVQCELVLDLVVDCMRDADAAPVGEAFQARADLYAPPLDLLPIHHHLPQV